MYRTYQKSLLSHFTTTIRRKGEHRQEAHEFLRRSNKLEELEGELIFYRLFVDSIVQKCLAKAKWQRHRIGQLVRVYHH